MGAMMLSIDAGNMWQTRRNLITATDASALDAARRAAIDGPASACDAAPGNWGFVDLDGGANSNQDLVNWLRYGYDGAVGVNDCNADGTTGDPCEADPGATGCSACTALQYLVDTQQAFSILVFDQ